MTQATSDYLIIFKLFKLQVIQFFIYLGNFRHTAARVFRT